MGRVEDGDDFLLTLKTHPRRTPDSSQPILPSGTGEPGIRMSVTECPESPDTRMSQSRFPGYPDILIYLTFFIICVQQIERQGDWGIF